MTLGATEQFRNNKKTAEKRIFELVNSKIDDLVDTAEYDWFANLSSIICRFAGLNLTKLCEQDDLHGTNRPKQLHANIDTLPFQHNEFNSAWPPTGDQGTHLF